MSNPSQYLMMIAARQPVGKPAVPPLAAPVPSLSGITTSAMVISWPAVAGAERYRVLRSLTANMANATEVMVANATLSVTGLNAKTTYYFTVESLADGRKSATSAVVSAKTGEIVVPQNKAFVLFISGQSNAQGNAEAREALYKPISVFAPDIYAPVAGSHIFNVVKKEFEPVTVGTNARPDGFGYPKGFTYEATEQGTWGGPTYYGDFLGAEYGLAKFCEETGYPLYIVKYAAGGTHIAEWQKGTKLYNDLKMLKDAAIAKLTAAGKEVVIAGFYRNQGEADWNMSTAQYNTLLRQMYADLTADGFITDDTKIIECGCPVAADQGTPYFNAQNPVKKAWVAELPAKRFYIDESNVTLEHDEIHYDLPTQYKYGFELIPNIIFGLNRSLPASVDVPAPTLIHEAGTNTVLVKPETADWRQMEFYYELNGAAPKRLTTSFRIKLLNAVAQVNGLDVYARAVAGRNKSAVATNPALWQLNASAPVISTQPDPVVIVEKTTLTTAVVATGAGLTYKLFKIAAGGDVQLYSGSNGTFSKQGVIADSGSYYWMISNSAGVAISATIKIVVAATPTGLVTKLPDIGKPYLGVFEAETGLQNQVIGKNDLKTISDARTPEVSGTLGGKPAWVFDKATSDALIFNNCGNTSGTLLAAFILKASSFDTSGTIILETVGGTIWSSLNMNGRSHLQGLEMTNGITAGTDTVVIYWVDQANVAHVRINGVDYQTTNAGGLAPLPGNASLRIGGFTVDDKYDFDGLLGAHLYSDGTFEKSKIDALEAVLKSSRNFNY